MPYEGGTVVCEYPKDAAKPYMPVMYNGETVPGMEYQFAGVLASHGMIDEAIKVIRTVRNRFDGRKRNPWNEFECGSIMQGLCRALLCCRFSAALFLICKAPVLASARLSKAKISNALGVCQQVGEVLKSEVILLN